VAADALPAPKTTINSAAITARTARDVNISTLLGVVAQPLTSS
jgi:hypothetical protein